MSEISDKKYLTLSQKIDLVQFVEENYNTLFGRKIDERIKHNEWQLISMKLNAIGPMKTADGWKRCFTTLKAVAKAKYIGKLPLNDIDFKIAQMCNMLKLDISNEQLKKSKRHEKKPIKKAPITKKISPKQDIAALATATEPIGDKSKTPNQIVTNPLQEKNAYVTTLQKKRLVKVVGDNYSALYGKISTNLGAGPLKDKILSTITFQLNAIGPAKNVEGWQTCFNYLKSKTKEKLTSIRQYKMKFGASPTHIQLNEIDLEIVRMCNINTLDGHSRVSEMGLSQPSLLSANRIRPTSTVVSSTINPPLPSSTINPPLPSATTQNAGNQNDWMGPAECFGIDMRTATFTATQATTSISEGQEIRSEIPCSSAPRCANLDITAETESYGLSQTPACNDDVELLDYGNILDDKGVGDMFEEPFKRNTADESREEVFASVRQEIDSTDSRHCQGDMAILQEDLDVDMEIRPLEPPRPQRRGVEINNGRYVQPRRRITDEENDQQNLPRRNKLAVPLASMAAESLELQRKSNALLTELVHLWRTYTNV